MSVDCFFVCAFHCAKATAIISLTFKCICMHTYDNAGYENAVYYWYILKVIGNA